MQSADEHISYNLQEKKTTQHDYLRLNKKTCSKNRQNQQQQGHEAQGVFSLA